MLGGLFLMVITTNPPPSSHIEDDGNDDRAPTPAQWRWHCGHHHSTPTISHPRQWWWHAIMTTTTPASPSHIDHHTTCATHARWQWGKNIYYSVDTTWPCIVHNWIDFYLYYIVTKRLVETSCRPVFDFCSSKHKCNWTDHGHPRTGNRCRFGSV